MFKSSILAELAAVSLSSVLSLFSVPQKEGELEGESKRWGEGLAMAFHVPNLTDHLTDCREALSLKPSPGQCNMICCSILTRILLVLWYIFRSYGVICCAAGGCTLVGGCGREACAACLVVL